MESEPGMPPDAADRALRSVDGIRMRTAAMPRRHAVLQLLYTVMLAAYMALFVYTGSEEGGASVFGGTTMALVLPPMIISTGLINGAAERFARRVRTSGRQWFAMAFFLLMLLIVLIWGIAGDGYPWWLAPVYAVVTLVIFGVRPMSVLLRGPALPKQQGPREALSAGPRITTLLLGLFFAALCASLRVPTLLWAVMAIVLAAGVIALSAQTASWGLLRTGYEWGMPQWTAFGIAVAVMFGLAVLIIATDLVTPGFAAGAGVAVMACLVISAFLPGRNHGASST